MSLSTITLQYSSVRGKEKNTSYPFKAEVKTVDDLEKIARFDHVCGEYADGTNTRKNAIKGYRAKRLSEKLTACPWTATTRIRIRLQKTFRRASGKHRQMFGRRFRMFRFMWSILVTT